MNRIEEKVSEAICQNKHYLVAVSGGADSMVLLYACKKIAEEKDAFIRAITVEHGIRGEASKKDANFVCNYCKDNNIDCKLVHVNVIKLAKENKQTIEESARNLRYKAFFEELKQNEILLVAHNQNDQAETVLMHIFRGSGIDGARGIKERENLLRPLLGVSKTEILDYAKAHKIQFVTDETNDDTSYYRNYIRKEVLPKIEKIYPNVAENISKFAEYCAQSESLIESLVNPNWFVINDDILCLDESVLNQNPLVFAKSIKKAYNMLGEYSDLESKHIELIYDFWKTAKSGLILNIPHGIIVEKRKNNVIFYKIKEQNNSVCKFEIGENILPNGEHIFVEKISKEDIDYSGRDYFADYHKIPFDAVWRTRREGDRFQKLGSRGSKKLNDYFTDKKFDFSKRDSQILLAKNQKILFVEGIDVSDDIKVDAGTEVVVRFRRK